MVSEENAIGLGSFVKSKTEAKAVQINVSNVTKEHRAHCDFFGRLRGAI
jgi:hypothetical protein